MKAALYTIFFLFLLPGDNATSVLHKMYDRYHGHWPRTLHYRQETERYRNDTLYRKDTWYTAISYPAFYRVDFGEPQYGNAMLADKDSSWFFKDGHLSRADDIGNATVFLLGGMYFYPFDTVLRELKKMGYALDMSCTGIWKGRPVYIIGADREDERVNMIWIDKEKLVPLHYMRYDDGPAEEGFFDNQVLMDGCWVGTKATFYRNGHLLQREKYVHCVVNDTIDRRVFDPALFGQYHWYKE